MFVSNPEASTLFHEAGYSETAITNLASRLTSLDHLPQFVPPNVDRSTLETPYRGALSMVQSITANRDLILESWPPEANSDAQTVIQTLSLATLLSDIGKASEPGNPTSQVVPRIYLEVFQMKNGLRDLPLNQALAAYSQTLIPTGASPETLAEINQNFPPLSQAETAYLQSLDLLGPDFDPDDTPAGQVFTKLHLRVAQKLFKELGIQDHPEVIIALSHHFDQGECPASLSLPPDNNLLNHVAFVSLFDKLHASIYRGGNQPHEAIEKIASQVSQNLNQNHHDHAPDYLPIYTHWLTFFRNHLDQFFPQTPILHP